jgi:hypothetical protein
MLLLRCNAMICLPVKFLKSGLAALGATFPPDFRTNRYESGGNAVGCVGRVSGWREKSLFL